MAASYGGRFVSQLLVGWIPFFGNAVNVSTAVAITEKMGWAIADKFDAEQKEEAHKEELKEMLLKRLSSLSSSEEIYSLNNLKK